MRIAIMSVPLAALTATLIIVVLASIVSGPAPDVQQRDMGTAEPYGQPVLDANYDDSWVASVPEFLGGHRVLHISTPKSRACSSDPIITLIARQESMNEFLESAPS